MATSQSTMEFLLDVLADSRQVTARRMFSEYCLYFAGRPAGLVRAAFEALPPPKAPRTPKISKPLSPRDNAATPTLRRKSAKA